MRKSTERAKGFVLGFILATAISATVVFATNYATLIEIVHGVSVVVNGNAVSFDEDSRPFISAGRTFLPLRALADALDLPLQWDPTTSTAYIGERPVTEEILLGKWRVAVFEDIHMGTTTFEETEGIYLEFLADGSLLLIDYDTVDNLYWTLDGNIVHFIDPRYDDYIILLAELSGATLLLTWEDIFEGSIEGIIIMHLYRY